MGYFGPSFSNNWFLHCSKPLMISTNESFVMVLSKVICNESRKRKINHGKKFLACLRYFLMNKNSFYNNPLNSKTVWIRYQSYHCLICNKIIGSPLNLDAHLQIKQKWEKRWRQIDDLWETTITRNHCLLKIIGTYLTNLFVSWNYNLLALLYNFCIIRYYSNYIMECRSREIQKHFDDLMYALLESSYRNIVDYNNAYI